MRLRKYFSSIAVFALILSLGSVAYARDTDWTNGSSFSWSPILTRPYVSEGATSYLYVSSEFYFDDTAASENNSMYYFTMEHNASVDGFAKDSLYSNIPDPHFDWDDDNDDGYHEEAEVSIEADFWKDSLEAYTDYYFNTWWLNTKSKDSPSGDVYFIAQRSLFNLFNQEYEGWHYDLLETGTHPSIPHQ